MSQEEVKSTSKTITVSAILTLLDEGKSRKEIAEFFGESEAAMKAAVWSHPKLKNRKARKQHNVQLVDDTVDVIEETVDTETKEEIAQVSENVVETIAETTETKEVTEQEEGEIQDTNAPVGDQEPAQSNTTTSRSSW